MAIWDPKKTLTKTAAESDDPADDFEASAPSLEEQVATLQAQVTALLEAKSGGGLTDARLEQILTRVTQMSAEAHERAANPSNKTHPGISVFSYPEGDRERRRPDLKCPMFWAGYPLDWDTTTAEEIELLNLAEPGIYAFKLTDRKTLEKLTIEGERDAGGKISRLLFKDFVTKENHNSLPAMVSMLRDAFKVKSPEQLELETLRAEVAKLRETTGVPA